MKHANLMQHGSPVVINSLPGQTVIRVERVHAAKRKFNSSSRGWQTSPWAEMRSPNYNFYQNSLIGDMLPLHLDHEIR